MFTSDHYSNTIGIRPLLPTKWKFNNIEAAPNCPRCASSNTKFCYYNNYSLSQPRYFCKACRRYWTKGGSLRNVPVGGGCRKSRRSRRQPAPASSTDRSSSNGGACIDMAAVFAKYVNQNLENNINTNDESSAFSPGASTGSSSDNIQASTTFDVDNDSQFEDINNNNNSTFVGDHDQMQQEVVPQIATCHDVSGQHFVYGDCSGFELQQGVLCDELSPEILWSEGTTLPNLGFQQQTMVQVEDCGLFAADDYDQLRISANLVSDNWGSFDLSAYDFYSTP